MSCAIGEMNSYMIRICVFKHLGPIVLIIKEPPLPLKTLPSCVPGRGPKIGTQNCSTRRGVRKVLHLELALNHKELVKAEVFEKYVASIMCTLLGQ